MDYIIRPRVWNVGFECIIDESESENLLEFYCSIGKISDFKGRNSRKSAFLP